MANTRQVKQRIQTAKNISKITKAMEMVSASKMRRAQEQALAARPFAQALMQSLRAVASASSSNLHPLLRRNTSGYPALVVLTTDRGLSGNMNAQLIKLLLDWLELHPDGKIIMIGRKGSAFARLVGLELSAQFTDIPERVSSKDIVGLSKLIMSKYIATDFMSVDLLYTDFINTLSQKAVRVGLLPLSEKKIEAGEPSADAANGYVPAKKTEKLSRIEYVFEPSAASILSKLLPYYVENTLFQAFLESRASEHSARMVTMKNASENASDLVGDLTLVYNKSRQASITSELLDITTATLTLDS